MPRFYFNIDDGLSTLDVEGTEIGSLAEARCQAIKMAGHIMCEAAGTFWDHHSEWIMTVTDEQRLTMFTLQICGTDAPATRHRPLP